MGKTGSQNQKQTAQGKKQAGLGKYKKLLVFGWVRLYEL